MANIASQIKRNRQNEKARARNKTARSRMRSTIRSFTAAVESGDRDAATEAFQAASRELDKAASRGVIHRNRAADRKSRLARKLASIQ